MRSTLTIYGAYMQTNGTIETQPIRHLRTHKHRIGGALIIYRDISLHYDGAISAHEGTIPVRTMICRLLRNTETALRCFLTTDAARTNGEIQSNLAIDIQTPSLSSQKDFHIRIIRCIYLLQPRNAPYIGSSAVLRIFNKILEGTGFRLRLANILSSMLRTEAFVQVMGLYFLRRRAASNQ